MKSNDPKWQLIQSLQQAYVPNDNYTQRGQRFEELTAQRRADIKAGLHSNVRGIVLVGRSGSGKSAAFRELMRCSKDLVLDDPKIGVSEVVSVQVPSPATLKFVGVAVLQALGYPLARDKSVALIWGQVKDHLKRRKTLFLHLDGAQDLTRYQTQNERVAVVRTLKSLMENSSWPVGLILSGMPELADLINADPQLGRRLYPISISRLNSVRDRDTVCDILSLYAARAGLGAQQA
ncbi:ATP-binding protein [Shimia ponticola]|uniref:ATP-binding protein n=1 Tax=Shimia ponticola TaxID=2582893 RepID=UPI00164B3F44|nr:ATP-binding protein [Shimia ponticola]